MVPSGGCLASRLFSGLKIIQGGSFLGIVKMGWVVGLCWSLRLALLWARSLLRCLVFSAGAPSIMLWDLLGPLLARCCGSASAAQCAWFFFIFKTTHSLVKKKNQSVIFHPGEGCPKSQSLFFGPKFSDTARKMSFFEIGWKTGPFWVNSMRWKFKKKCCSRRRLDRFSPLWPMKKKPEKISRHQARGFPTQKKTRPSFRIKKTITYPGGWSVSPRLKCQQKESCDRNTNQL